MSKYTVKITDNDGNDHSLRGNDIPDLQCALRMMVNENGFGASDIGAEFPVVSEGERVGTMFYNGRYKTC